VALGFHLYTFHPHPPLRRDFDKYAAIMEEVFGIVRRHSPRVVVLSIDEAVGGHPRGLGPPVAVGAWRCWRSQGTSNIVLLDSSAMWRTTSANRTDIFVSKYILSFYSPKN